MNSRERQKKKQNTEQAVQSEIQWGASSTQQHHKVNVVKDNNVHTLHLCIGDCEIAYGMDVLRGPVRKCHYEAIVMHKPCKSKSKSVSCLFRMCSVSPNVYFLLPGSGRNWKRLARGLKVIVLAVWQTSHILTSVSPENLARSRRCPMALCFYIMH